MIEATGGRRYYNCQWAQEDVEKLYNLLNNNNIAVIFPSVLCLNNVKE